MSRVVAEADGERQQRRAVDPIELGQRRRRRRPRRSPTSASGSRSSSARIVVAQHVARIARRLPSAFAAASSARWRTGAAARSSADRWTFRDESARPSGSRTVGQAMTSVGDRQVACHPADDHHLLGVLLAEVGVLGADQVEQDRDDGRHAVEMARPRGALERPRDRPDADDRVEAGRIDLRRVGREDDVDALRLADREVARLVARVLREVVGDVELARVDEDRDDGRRVVRAGDAASAPGGRRGASPSSARGRSGRGASRSASRRSARVRTIRVKRAGALLRGRGRAGCRPPGSSRPAGRASRGRGPRRGPRRPSGRSARGPGTCRRRRRPRRRSAASRISPRTRTYGLACFGMKSPSPIRSVMTWTWPLQPAPAPIPIVGMWSRSVIAAASCSGTSSRTIAKAPASWTASASARSARAWSRVLPWTRTLPTPLIDCGVRPMWPMTGMPARTSASMTRAVADAALDLDRLGAGLAQEDPGVVERLLGRRIGEERHVRRRPGPATCRGPRPWCGGASRPS